VYVRFLQEGAIRGWRTKESSLSISRPCWPLFVRPPMTLRVQNGFWAESRAWGRLNA
jgi:hypothetical protein